MSFNSDKLSYFHSFSKTPVQSGDNFADGTTLGNAINKSGHTVTASEVWAQDIPYYGKMGSLADVVSKVQPYARKNDMCFITAGADKGKTYIYDGSSNWTLVNGDGYLDAGQLIKNSKDENVLLYHEGEKLTNLTADNNANTDSANNAARLWTNLDVDGTSLGEGVTRLVEQFVAPTDKALNGLASVAFAPGIGTLVSGTDYYDYCFSGTILWASASSAARNINCFEYVGSKVSTVVDTVAAQGTTLQSVKDLVDEIAEEIGAGNTATLGSRVTALETTATELDGRLDSVEATLTSGVVASVSASDKATAAGVTASTTDKVVTIDVTVGSVASGVSAVVSGGAVHTAIESAKSTLQSAIDGKVAQSAYDTKVGELTTAVQNAASAASEADAKAQAASAAAAKALTDANAYTDGEIDKVEKSLSDALEAHSKDIEAVTTAINGLTTTGLTREIVDALPTTGIKANAIYLVPDAKAEAGVYIEYIYVGELGEGGTGAVENFEPIGSTKTDLSGYTTDDEFNGLADRVSTAEGEIDTLQSQITTKAAQSDLTALTTRVTTAEGKITTIEGNITSINTALDSKATVADLTALTTRVSTAEGEIDTLQSEITTKAAAADLTALTKTVTDNETDIEAKIAALTTVVTDNKKSADQTQTDLDTLEGKVADIEAIVGGAGSGSLTDMLAAKVDNVTGGGNGISISTSTANGSRTATLSVSADTSVNSGSTNVVTSGAVYSAIESAKSTLQTSINGKVDTTTYTAAIEGINTTLAGKAAQSDVTDLAGRMTTAEGKITDLETFVNSGADTKITAAIEKLDSTKSNAGVQVVQENGVITSVTVTSGSVAANDASVVTGGVVYTAIEGEKSRAEGAYAKKNTETVAANAASAASAAQTTANEAKALGEAAATKTALSEVEAKIPTTYVKSVNGISNEVKITGFESDYETNMTALYPTIGTTSVKKKGNDIFLSSDGLWYFEDGPGLDGYLPETTSIINGILDDKTFVNLEKCTEWTRPIGGASGKLTTFITDLPNLTYASGMFMGETAFTTFRGNLGSLEFGGSMFEDCKLDADSVMYIADGIKDWGADPIDYHQITIHVDSTLVADTTVASYFTEIAGKGWTVASNHTVAAATAANGKTDSAVYVITRPCDEKRATHTTKDGKFVAVEVAKSVIGPHQHLWSIYASKADAILDMELTAI